MCLHRILTKMLKPLKRRSQKEKHFTKQQQEKQARKPCNLRHVNGKVEE